MRGFGFKYMLPKFNLVGQKFSRLTVVKFLYINKWGNSCWKCKCDCGQSTIISSAHLQKNNHTKSCGCFSKIYPSYFKHGMRHTKFYNIWTGIRRRCFNRNNQIDFKRYGGRGITVCKQWLKFENFRDDMYKCYKEHCNKYGEYNTSIDRINNNGNYCKSNCKFSTRKEQANNRRSNHLLTYKRQTLTIAQWGQKLNFGISVIPHRLNRGWSIPKILTTPVRKS